MKQLKKMGKAMKILAKQAAKPILENEITRQVNQIHVDLAHKIASDKRRN